MFKTMNDVKKANKALGHHWFDDDSMRFFNTEILSTPGLFTISGTGRQFFITSDRPELSDPKRYSIREVKPDGAIDTYGMVRDYTTQIAAFRAAMKAFG